MSSHGKRGDLYKIVRLAQSQGWEVKYTGKGHYCWVPPNGKDMYFSSSTPSDWRVIRNLLAALGKRGLTA